MSIIEVRVILENVEPVVERTLHLPLLLRLDRLHLVLQAAMGWQDCHMYMFQVGDTRWGVPDPDYGSNEKPANKTTFADLIAEGTDYPIQYIYDFGDNWEHTLIIGKTSDPVSGYLYPKLIDMKGHCPPEDVGDVTGYEYFLEAMADPKHSEHDDLKDWYGQSFDPHAPETDELKFAVMKLAKRWQAKKKRS